MAIGARPNVSLIRALALQLGLLLVGAALDASNLANFHSIGYGLFGVLAAAGVFIVLWTTCIRRRRNQVGVSFSSEETTDEDRNGMWAIVIVAAAVLALVSILIRILQLNSAPAGDWNWLGLLGVAVLVLLAAWLAAREWTRRVFAVTLLALFVIGGTGIFVLGSRVSFDSSMQELTASTQTALRRLSAEEHEKIESDAAEARAKFEQARSDLAEAVQVAPTAVAGASAPLREVLDSMPDNPGAIDIAVAKEALEEMLRAAAPVGYDQPSALVRAAAPLAVAAIPPEPAEPVNRSEVNAALAALSACRANRYCSREAVFRDAHKVRVTLAQYTAQLEPSDKALEKAATDLLTAEPESLTVSPSAAISAGANAVVAAFGSTHRPAIELGPFGWGAVALCVILYLRWLLTINNAQRPGPVKIESSIGGDSDGSLKTIFEVAVLKNLAGTGSTPGASVVGAAADLVSAVDEKAGPLMKALTAAWAALVPPAGYTVSASLETKPAPAAGKESAAASADQESSAATDSAEDAPAAPTRVLVTITTSSSGETLKSEVFVEDSAEAAARAAGLWAAAFILARSTRVPSWARWSAGTARALATSISPKPTLDELAAASRAAPASGLTLALYGGELELKGRRLDAIEAYARAVANHPRYMVARYRLAAALCMSTRGEDNEWSTVSSSRRAALSSAVGAAVARLGQALPDGFNSPIPGVAQASVRLAGVQIFETIQADHGWRQRWTANLRQSERSKNWRKALHPGTKAAAIRMLWLAKSGILVNSADDVPKLLAAVQNESDRPGSSFQVSYNLACYYATRDATENNRRSALHALERCLMRPGVESLRSDWVRTDPDLTSLVGRGRFEHFCDQLSGGGEP